jgi:hypothetical protein
MSDMPFSQGEETDDVQGYFVHPPMVIMPIGFRLPVPPPPPLTGTVSGGDPGLGTDGAGGGGFNFGDAPVIRLS